ncbi:MAG: tRNA (adenosine(37)-N6)-threonylcarbamoyltransferase complex dimerization subunit type 1 TsaB [Fimbriimonadales bacterium]|nr:tRNA (adenosine(37)-N6)-threonylcarbamoyltransferase complex dimerization subunit type 1 TsaB [Fimbriimonadales bacterium]
MILCVSTSSPLASVAALDGGRVLGSMEAMAPRGSGGAVLQMTDRLLQELGLELGAFELFVADVGPGGFTGVRVGVALARAWAWILGNPVGSVSAFDLVDPIADVAVPVRKGLYILRRASGRTEGVAAPPRGCFGYGPHFEHQAYPRAANLLRTLDRVERVNPHRLLPAYHSLPNISEPSRPFGPTGVARA